MKKEPTAEKGCCSPSKDLTAIPQEVEIKPAFAERYKELLGDRYDEFIKFSLAYIRKCVRVNTLKATPGEVQKRLAADWLLEPIPWCPEGFYISYKHGKRFDIGNLIEHQLGLMYVQDAASMIPPIVLEPQPGETVLDLCAAPGSKTTQMAAMMKNSGVIIANDVQTSRMKPLGLNLQRCGVANTVVAVRANKKLLQEQPASFDRVLVDAPCSGTGTVRRSLKTLLMWSPGLIAKLVREQKKLIQLGFDLLKPGGTLVYSTCTLEPDEDEGIVTWLLEQNENAGLLPIKLNINRSPAIKEWQDQTFHKDIDRVLRIYPQDNNTEGFFVAKIQKKE